jgi:hypothetical protein
LNTTSNNEPDGGEVESGEPYIINMDENKLYKRKFFSEEKKEGINLKKDIFKVDMNKVKKYDNLPPYLRMVQKEIKNGKGLVQVYDIENGLAEIYAEGSMSYIIGAPSVPLDALIKVK